MTNPLAAVIPEVKISDNRAITTSIAVANYFQKRHDHVMDKIRAVMADCDPAYRLPNFRETVYDRENPSGGATIQAPMFELTRDAFVLIVMGFTGKRALQWKIDYINAFNKMEEELQRKHRHPVIPERFLVTLKPDGGYFTEAVPQGSFVSTAENLPQRLEAEIFLFSQQQLIQLMFTCMKHIHTEHLIVRL